MENILKQKIFDYYIPSKKVLVEVDGDYFHANPQRYDENNRSKLQERVVKKLSICQILDV